jgi:uncharacterized protein YdhG (YjbR/CyaY superfamily)
MMAKNDWKSVDEYIAMQPDDAAAILNEVRQAIQRALPGAEETISYKIPTYKLESETVLYFAGWKHHYSLYPAGASLVAAFGDELAPYAIEKATIRFSFGEPVPVKLIERIAKFRAKELAGRAQLKEMRGRSGP